ncbi:MAG: DNA polymerase III subunit psi [Betaproteobacteria bacterium]|nr:DNA polymerase III subunit psi [Betaproteobacteria bacterium]
MLSDAALEVLELAPIWQLRPQKNPPQPIWMVRVLTDADGATGWMVLEKTPVDDAAMLLGNVFRALQLSMKQEFELVRVELGATMQIEMPQWLWVCHPQLFQQLSQSENDQLNPVAGNIGVSLYQASCPVFLSEPPEQLLANAGAKAQLWADWCVWQLSRAKRVP